MIAVFQTERFGQIEVDTETRVVYIKAQDYEVMLSADNEFEDWFGRKFRILLPHRPGSSISIETIEWRTIASISNPTANVQVEV